MASTLSKIGITTGNTVETWHVTQSIDAFTGTEAYDITISGSLILGSGTTMNGTASYSTNALLSQTAISSSYATTSSHAITAISSSFATTSSYAVTASYALNAGEGGASFPYTGSAIISGSLIVTGSVAFNGDNFYSPYTSVDNSSAVNTAIENVAYAGGTLLVDLGISSTNDVRLSLDTTPLIPTKYTILFTNPTPGAGADFRLQQTAGKMYGNILGAQGGTGQFISASSLIQSNAGKPYPDTKVELTGYSSGWNVQIYTATGSEWTVS